MKLWFGLRKIVGDKGVKLPPPSFSTAIKISDSKEIDVIGIDMDEVSFTKPILKIFLHGSYSNEVG